jgi:putative hemolysin
MPSHPSFRLDTLLARFLPAPLPRIFAPTLERLLSLRRLERTYHALGASSSPVDFAQRALCALGVSFRVSPADVARLPCRGPLVVVANHPYGGIEGLAVVDVLARRRADLRLLGNDLLRRLPELAPLIIAVDNAGPGATTRNAQGLRAALRHLQAGGALIVFPAGEVSALQPLSTIVADPPWALSIARLVRLAHAAVVPVYFDGANSALFQAAGLLHPRLRTLLLPRELLNKRRRKFTMRIGDASEASSLQRIDGDGALCEFLRLRTYALAPGGPNARGAAPVPPTIPAAHAEPARMAEEIGALGPAARLVSTGGLELWHARAGEIPWLLAHVARQRAASARASGEGTGRAAGADLYDEYYEQLLLWNPARRELVAGCRLAALDRLRAHRSRRALYSQTLFEFGEPLLRLLGPALEVSRCWVRPDDQRGSASLLALWRGVAAYVAMNPRYAVLFGPLRISAGYTPAARALLTEYLQVHHADALRMHFVRARAPVMGGDLQRLLRRELADVMSMEAFDRAVAAQEPDGKGVPVLLKQHLRLGGRVLGFSVDAQYSGAIDALIVTDLRRSDPRQLARYLGSREAQRFLASHRPRRVPSLIASTR